MISARKKARGRLEDGAANQHADVWKTAPLIRLMRMSATELGCGG